ncbi:hypothetical protein TWF173_007154 [Orbilia oligospora]|uniref:Uncharacterized protein n=2 Tax=Orbilia oligospora TaxID=2813651 RepID=G1XM25_ARTOA|nr:hypothetical protein AOL_s00117g72 [Orbilia oligospora ATCC 24927]EGX45867.1 hypothetical protein AOL_s00117g72 [Orbilia oligospora ATCC 24927]KAF3284293.1 hypothetical protein TWF970_011513 [Orbilia oligospora]KAF3312544.1 hypothetical protein TWF173_007154 [Orbilia oligospora]
MIAQFLRTAFRPTTMWSTSRFVPEKAAPSEMRTFSSLQTPTPKTFTIFGTEYSRKRVYTIAGLVLLADMAIFDYYYFFASKKTGN